MDWAVHLTPVKWKEDRPSTPRFRSPAEKRADLVRLREDRIRRESAVKSAREYWAGCKPARTSHPYLEKKGLGMIGTTGLRTDRKGWLVVPIVRSGQIVSLERISPEGEKLFWKGAPSGGGSHLIRRNGATITVLCEGLATGLTVFEADPLCRVIVCLTAGNLPKVASTLRMPGMYAVAADNDHGTEQTKGINPGIIAAVQASSVLGCGYAAPSGIQGTDWNDLVLERIAIQERMELAGRSRYRMGGHNPMAAKERVRRSALDEVKLEVRKAARLMPSRRMGS
jgi:putative DNA primase/helicase